MMLVLYGPTTTGKTNLAIKLAKKYNGELISADSRQVYKWLDIGTGKVSQTSVVKKHNDYWIVDGIKINGFDLNKPGSRFTVADFISFSKAAISKIEVSQKMPIIVGGTGFYIQALIQGIGTLGIASDPKLRKELEKYDASKLYKILLTTNTSRAKSMNQSDKQNPRRLVRAIEIAKSGKNILKEQYQNHYDYLIIGLTAPNRFLFKRADKWLDGRLAIGLIEEVDNLIKQGVSPDWLTNLGLEYKWITQTVLGRIPQGDTVKKLKGDIHDLIRRQKTYFRQFPDIQTFDISKKNWMEELEKYVHNWYTQKNG